MLPAVVDGANVAEDSYLEDWERDTAKLADNRGRIEKDLNDQSADEI